MTRPRFIAGALTVGLASVLAAGACASRSENTGAGGGSAAKPAADSAAGAAQRGDGQAYEAAPPAAPNNATDQQNNAPKLKVAPAQRSIIYTGAMAVRVKKVDVAADEAGRIAVAAGGLVGADKRTIDADRSIATVVLRVPADRFTSTLNQLAGLGDEESRELSQDDVTEAVVDLDARIVSQQASVDRVRALMAKANTVGEVFSVESELARREADLAALQARKRSLADQVDLSTITLTLRGPAAEAPPKDDETGFLAGLKGGWKAFVASIKVALTVLGAVLPFALIIGVPLWLVYWFVLRRRRQPTVRPAVATTYGLPLPETPEKPDPTAPKSTVD